MNGIALAQLHVRKGTRTIIDDIDDLRITFGFSTVEVVTVIVESRLRGGLKTNKPLTLNCHFSERNNLNVELTFNDTFPAVPLVAVVSVDSGDIGRHLTELTQNILSNSSDEDTYIRAVPLVKCIVSEYDRLVPPISVEGEVVVADESEDNIVEIVDSAESLVLNHAEAQYAKQEELNSVLFSCRKCRTIVFEPAELHPHSVDTWNSPKCTSFYLSEPPLNLKLFSESEAQLAESGDTQGKLLCNCKASVGHWSWTSHRCSCGEWISPVFQFVKSKLDVKKRPV